MNCDVINAYAAGLIDGEGSISVDAFVYHRCHRLHTAIAVIMTSRDPCEFMATHFGGRVTIHSRKTVTGRTVYRWHAAGKRAEAVALAILPYSTCKRAQLDLLLQARKLINIYRRNEQGHPIFDPIVWQKKQDIAAAIKRVRSPNMEATEDET